ncbi:MAG: TonB-dependent receptor, partial [Caldisericia bacterium]|nr:TonB-dependent receptor [Caldisericia bacterium]
KGTGLTYMVTDQGTVVLKKAKIVVAQREEVEKKKVEEEEVKRPVEIEEMVVTATRTERPVFETPIPVGIITREDIEEKNPISVPDMLQKQVGVSQIRGTPVMNHISMRGFSTVTGKIPVLIDGNPFRGGRTRTFALIDPNQIERVEIVRGPVSSLYGTEALGGVINIITRKAKPHLEPRFSLEPRLRPVSYSSANNMFRTGIELEGGGYGFDFLLGYNYRNAYDDMRTPKGDIPYSKFNDMSWDLRAGYQFDESRRLEFILKEFQGENQGISAIRPPFPNLPPDKKLIDPDDQHDIEIRFEDKDIGDIWKSFFANVYYKRQDATVAIFSHAYDKLGRLTKTFDHLRHVPDDTVGGRAYGTFQLGYSHKVTTGIDSFWEKRYGLWNYRDIVTHYDPLTGDVTKVVHGIEGRTSPNATMLNIGYFVQDEFDVTDRLLLILGGRFDYFRTKTELSPVYVPEILPVLEENQTVTDTVFTGNLNLLFRITENVNLTGGIARAYCQPQTWSKFAFARTVKGFNVPNPAIKPEKTMNYEIGLKVQYPAFSGAMNLFLADSKDVFVRKDITFRDLPSIQLQNIGKAQRRGFEVEASYIINHWLSVFGNVSYVWGKDKITDDPLPEIPPLNGILGIRFAEPSKRYWFEFISNIVGNQTRNAPNEIETPGYATFDLRGGIKIRDFDLSLAIENLLDRSYRNHLARGNPGNQNVYDEPGINAVATLMWRF